MDPNPDVSWWNATLWKNDPLYNEIAFGTSGMHYFLGHHTFSHQNLNNVTYADAMLQIRLNQVRSLRTPGPLLLLLPLRLRQTTVLSKYRCLPRSASEEVFPEQSGQKHSCLAKPNDKPS
jgi:hypothetical protein